MGGVDVGEDEGFLGKRLTGDTSACSNLTALHRRSKSASEKSEDISISRPGDVILSKHAVTLHIGSPASAGTYGSQTPPRGMSVDSSTSSSSNHRASLEKDIQLLQLRLQQEKSMRVMLEKAIGRASSTLSPGHRHFDSQSQTKDLIAEIDLLEEEVANREQHVLALYRGIFEQCLSTVPSEQSSGLCSPAHAKIQTRKHPSIISSAFCSSKKFPLRPFQVLSSKSGSGRKELKARQSSFSTCKSGSRIEKISSNPVKVQGKTSTTEKVSIVRTLKDHLHQCPCKLSEEMVRCMAAVYCWLVGRASVKSEKNKSPEQFDSQAEHYHKSMVEISSIPADKSQFSRASYAINGYRVLVEQLERVNVMQMDNKARIAFWVNVYNALIMHAYLAYGIPQSSLKRLSLFHKAAYNIGGHVISANTIEHAIFCFRTPRSGGWIETIISTALRKKSKEEKQEVCSKFGLVNSQPLVCFALCTGALSDPVLRVYTASNVNDQLEAAKREFLQANIAVKKSKKVFLPKLLERYSREGSVGSLDLLKWVCENVEKELHDSIRKCICPKTNKKASQVIDWLPYSSKFRYLLSDELAAKPWWM